MRKPLLRKIIWTLAVVATVVLAVIVALPFAASTHLVRDRIGQEIGFWTGYRVNVGARPEIKVWPNFSAVLHDVTFTDWDAPETPVLQTRRVEIDMSALAALRGDVYFNRVRFVDPILHVAPDPSYGYSPTLPRGGKIVRSVIAAQRAREDNPEAPDLEALPDDPLGTIEFADGNIVLHDGNREHLIAADLTGTVKWPALNRGGSLTLEGEWHGEAVAIEAASTQPLLHMAGAESDLRLSLRSPQVNAAFDGRIGIEDDGLVEGLLQISTPSLSNALDWLRLAPGASLTAGALEFSSQISGTTDRLKFTNASLVLSGSTGIGSMDIALGDQAPVISGGVAFETVDLPTLLALFSPVLPESEGTVPVTPLLENLSLDLRLSAGRATAGPVTLNEVALTAQVRPGLTVLDLSDAAAWGGVVQAGLRVARDEGGADTVDLRLLASGINGEAAGDALGLARLLPTSLGTLSLTASGLGETWDQVFSSAQGTFAAEFGAGTLRQFDLEDFLARLQENTFFALGAVAAGSVPIEGLQVKASVENGIARLAGTALETPAQSILINGIVPYGGGLALTGSVHPRSIVPADPAGAVAVPSPPSAAFFVGGSWAAPFVSPASPRTAP